MTYTSPLKTTDVAAENKRTLQPFESLDSFWIGLYRENTIAIESEARYPNGGNGYSIFVLSGDDTCTYVTMQITYLTDGHLKVKVVLYSAISGPLDRSKRFTLFALPGRPVHSDTNSASPGSILAMVQLRAKTKLLTFPPLSISRYSFI